MGSENCSSKFVPANVRDIQNTQEGELVDGREDDYADM